MDHYPGHQSSSRPPSHIRSSQGEMKRSPPDMGPPAFPHSFPPPNIFYANDGHPPGPSVPLASSSSNSTYHQYPPGESSEGHQHQQDRNRPSLSLSLPPPHLNHDAAGPFTMPINYMGHGGHTPLVSPYQTTPGGMTHPHTSGSEGAGMTEYFPPFPTGHSTPGSGFLSPGWAPAASTSTAPPQPTRPAAAARSASGGAKTSRQQFTACGACRHRRVKCDLKEKQDTLEKENRDEDEGRVGPTRTTVRRKKAICTNCEERGTNCVDEYAPLKAAKQLRRGKRISEIEMLYGKTAASAAVAANPDDGSDRSDSPAKGKEREAIPELTREFFDSPFFRRFQVQRPILDPQEFVVRYLSRPHPCAAAMGPEGAILVHVIYAWAVSYGVDERGRLDIPEGGGSPFGPLPLMSHGESEVQRESDRQRRFEKMRYAIEVVLREIDECGVMRKPTWDGVRALLLVLPLTEGVESPMQRLSMYEAALNQVYTLCSFGGLGYDGMPSGASAVNGGSDGANNAEYTTTRVRIYWYAFVHEGITTGLKGGRLLLDDEDLDTIQDSIHNRALVHHQSSYRSMAKFATAPINLALACRLINKALTGPSAKRRLSVNADSVREAWEALERCWEEFEALKYAEGTGGITGPEDIIRFADGWKIFLFEAQNIIRRNLEERLSRLLGENGAYINDASSPTKQREVVNVRHLLEIAKSKCEVQTAQTMEMVKRHVGTRFFEWDASLVRDGTYYAAMLLTREGGSDEDVSVCLQALNELRWAHAKAWDRSADLRREWQEARKTLSPDRLIRGWTAGMPAYLPPITAPKDLGMSNMSSNHGRTSAHSASPFTSPSTHGAPLSSSYDTNAMRGYIPAYVPSGVGADRQPPPHVKSEYGGGGQGAVYGSMPGPPPLPGIASIQGQHESSGPHGAGRGHGHGHGQGQGGYMVDGQGYSYPG